MTVSDEIGGNSSDTDTDWGWIFGALMCHGAMRKSEIMSTSLPALYAIIEEVSKHAALYANLPLAEINDEALAPNINNNNNFSTAAFAAMINEGFAKG